MVHAELLCLRVLDQLLEPLQLRRIDLLVVQHVQDEEARRVVEQSPRQVPECAAAGLPLVDDGTVDERPRDLVVDDVALRFQNAQNGLDRAVRDRVMFLERVTTSPTVTGCCCQTTAITRASASVRAGEDLRAIAMYS